MRLLFFLCHGSALSPFIGRQRYSAKFICGPPSRCHCFLSKILENESICDKDIEELDKDIFEGSDIFLDAVLAKGGKGNRVLGADYITPALPLGQKPDEESESDTYHQDLARSDLRVPFHSASCNAPKRHRNFRRE